MWLLRKGKRIAKFLGISEVDKRLYLSRFIMYIAPVIERDGQKLGDTRTYLAVSVKSKRLRNFINT